mgnify:CR=1 FL=1
MQLLRFTNSGTEATMSAIRLARGFTGRPKIIKFSGCYHGHVDSLLVKAGSGALTFGLPNSPGVPKALADLTLGDALKVVGYMRPKLIKAGTIIIQEGEVRQNDYMLLVLEGDIAVENELPGLNESMVVNVIGPGHLIGEMGLLDGSPRSATCTATTDIVVAVLTRTALMRLLKQGVTNDPEQWALRPARQSLALADYLAFFATLPQANREAITERWGAPEQDPMLRSGRLLLNSWLLVCNRLSACWPEAATPLLGRPWKAKKGSSSVSRTITASQQFSSALA